MKKILIILIILISITSWKSKGAISFLKYQVEQGLSHNTVWCMMQDSYDFMWFGTSDGLNLFDGNNFRIYKNDAKDTHSIGNNFIKSLCEDAAGNIWVGTNKGVYLFDRKMESFAPFSVKTEDGVLISSIVTKILRAKNGQIWIATLGQGIFIYDPHKEILTQNSMLSSHVMNVLQIPDGRIFLTSRQNGLICFDANGKYLKSFFPENNKLNNTEINTLFYQNNKLWFNVGTFGFYEMNTLNGQIRSISNNQLAGVSNIRKIFQHSKDILWIGGDNGLYQFNVKTETILRIDQPSNPRSLSDQSVYDIVRDREGGIWVSTYLGGVNYLPENSKPFEHYYPRFQSGSISGKAISQFCEDEKENLWIATEDGGLNYFDTKSKQAKAFNPLNKTNSISHYNIHALMLDGDQLWIGTLSRGIDVMNVRNGQVKNYQHRRNDSKSVADNSIYSIYKDSKGEILVGTAWGLSVFNKNDDSFSLVEEIGQMVHIFDIHEDSRKRLWIATYNAGVFLRDPQTQKWTQFSHNVNDPNSIQSNRIISLFEDKNHTMWFGTEGNGLCYRDEKLNRFVDFDPENNLLPNSVIYAIEQDEFDNFWISGNAGLLRINPYTKKNRLVFTKADGLQSNQFNFRSSVKARNGKMYFGGINGFNAFYPGGFNQNAYVPKVRIVDFKLFNKRVNVYDEDSPLSAAVYLSDKISLDHVQNSFSISFAALSFQAPEKNQYAFILEGADKEWNITSGGNNIATYNNLPPGKYTFRVKGSNNDAVWNESVSTIRIEIHPPFWKSGFAYFVYLLLIAGGVYLFYKNRIRKINFRNEERLKSFKEKQEKDSYLSKIDFFTNISHEIRTPLSLIKLPLERIIDSGDGNHQTKDFLHTMQKNTDYLLNLINELLDFRKTEEIEYQLHIQPCNINELIGDLHVRFTHPAEIKHIQLSLKQPEQPLIVGIDIDAFNKVVSNILSNALKYAKSTIHIELLNMDDYFEIQIADDGKGITEHDKKKIFKAFYQSDNSEAGTGIGLAFAKNLVEMHQGKLSIENNDLGGSTFVISIPKVHAHAADLLHKNNMLVYPEKNNLNKPESDERNLSQNSNLPKLLLVEDNPELLQLTSGYMSDFFSVFTAVNGKDALEILNTEDIELVVSDIMMPEMDGYELCEKIKSDMMNCHIPVILLTAKTNIESKITGLEFGSDAYLEKPFSMEHLHKQIDNLLNSRKLLRELFASSPLLSSVEIVVSKKDISFVEKLNNEISKHLLDVNFSIDTLSDFMNMSRSNFYRKIKSISGMSPNDYLKTIRLKKAAELLLSQDYRINEVYEQAGFSSSSYFAKCFRKQFGMLPKEFAKNALNPKSSESNE